MDPVAVMGTFGSSLDDANAKAANGSRTRVGCFRAISLSNG
jgi:hypothetical protein